jgi:hypothetical protein
MIDYIRAQRTCSRLINSSIRFAAPVLVRRRQRRRIRVATYKATKWISAERTIIGAERCLPQLSAEK